MKVAIPWDGNMVFQHFGQTKLFAIYEVENGEVKDLGILDPAGQGHGALAGILAAENINVLICGGIGGPAKQCLADAGITCIPGVSGWIKDVVAAYAAGELAGDPDFECDHHDHDHACGDHDHGCGNHGCH